MPNSKEYINFRYCSAYFHSGYNFQPLGDRGTEAIVLDSFGGVEGTNLVVYEGGSIKVHVGDEDPCRPH